MDKKGWCIFGCATVGLIVLILNYFYTNMEYIEAITSTVYPGDRKITGGYGLEKIFYYFQSLLYAYKDSGNPSETSTFFSLFPIPMVIGIYIWIKSKNKDLLLGLLLLVSIVLTLYILVGFPTFLANITLLGNSMPERVIDALGMIQIYLIIIIMSKYKDIRIFPTLINVVLSVLTAVIAMIICVNSFPEYLSSSYCVIMTVLITIICFCILENEKYKRNVAITLLIALSIITSIGIRPIEKGFEAIYSKPAASQIIEIVEQEPDAKWITIGGGIVTSGFTVACGAPTINSVNIYPNMTLWRLLDEEGIYENIYNRYAHIIVNLTNSDTSFELVQPDCFNLNLSYQDLSRTGCEYIFSTLELLNENKYVSLELIYSEYGIYIYNIIYK